MNETRKYLNIVQTSLIQIHIGQHKHAANSVLCFMILSSLLYGRIGAFYRELSILIGTPLLAPIYFPIVSKREESTFRCSQFKISNSTKEKGENRIGILESFLFWIIQPRSSLKTVKLATLWARWNHTAGDFKCMSPTFYTSLLNKFHKRNEQTLRKSSLPVVETV